MKKSLFLRLGHVFLLLAACRRIGLGQDCPKPTAQQVENVTTYVQGKYGAGFRSGLTLVSDEKANDACFWKFEYETEQKTRLAFYLSPDRTFLTPELYDLRQDPLAEDRKRGEALMKEFMADDPPIMGSAAAPVTVVVFSDFECPYCRRLKDMLERDVLPREVGRVRVAFKNFPLSMHPWAKPAALMATCAALQDEPDFWKVHDFLFDNQKSLAADNLAGRVTDFVTANTALDKGQFQVCVAKELSLGIVSKDLALGTRYGVRGTPTVFVNGVEFQGVQNVAQLIELIDQAANPKAATRALAEPASGLLSR